MLNCIHVIDPNVRRRAQVSRELHDQPMHVEIYESINEFVDVAPTDGLIFFADVSDSDGHHVNQITQQSEVWLPVIAYAEAPLAKDVVEAMLAGACGYLEWPFDRRELDVALSRAADEGERKLRRERTLSEAKSQIDALSRREKQVLTCLIGGLANKAIGKALGISPRTVEIHRSKVMMKLRAQSVADAVRKGLYAGLDEDQFVSQLH